jgi:hypothetical protein
MPFIKTKIFFKLYISFKIAVFYLQYIISKSINTTSDFSAPDALSERISYITRLNE